MECCLSHGLNIGLMKPNNQHNKEYKWWEAEKMLSPLMSIVESVLNNEGIPEEIFCSSLKNIIEMLIIKSSPCFQITLLKLLKKLIVDKDFDQLLQTIIESKFVYIMLYIVGNTLCPDIKAYCIKIINFLSNKELILYENYTTKEISTYLSMVLWNLSPKTTKRSKENADSLINSNLDQSCDSSKKDSKILDMPLISKTSKPKSISFYQTKPFILPINTAESTSNTQMISSFSLKKTKKPSFKLELNTKEMNKEFDIGGKKCDNIDKCDKIDEKEHCLGNDDQEYIEITHLATECVNYMRKNLKKLSFQSLIKTDYFNEKSKEEPQNIDLEEIEWDCEPLYNSIMEWLLKRNPASLESDLLIDDIDQIHNPQIIELVLDFYKKSPGCLKAKIIQDVYMLVKWNNRNIQIYLDDKEFIAWLLDILLDQQTLLKENERSAYDAAVYFFLIFLLFFFS